MRYFAFYMVGLAVMVGAVSLIPALLTLAHIAHTLRGF